MFFCYFYINIHSKILNNLNLAETSVIAFDIFFSEEDTQNPTKIFQEFNLNSENILNSDQLFLKSINNNNVILPLLEIPVKFHHNVKLYLTKMVWSDHKNNVLCKFRKHYIFATFLRNNYSNPVSPMKSDNLGRIFIFRS